MRSGGLRFSDIGHACLQSVPFDTGYAGPNGVEPQSYVNGNGTSYIYFGSGQFDGQGSGHDFNGTVSLLSRMTPQKQGIGGSSSVSPEPLETIMGMRRMLQLRKEEEMGLEGMKPWAWHSTLQIELDLDAKNTCSPARLPCSRRGATDAASHMEHISVLEPPPRPCSDLSFGVQLYMPSSGYVNNCDGGRSHTYCDYRQQ